MSNSTSAQLQFHKPAWLYESLPFLYLIAGALAVTKLDGGIASLSGALLILAGAWVLMIRRNYRRIDAAKPRSLHRSQQRYRRT